MALKPNLLSKNDLPKNTIIGGNVDPDKYIANIKIAQDGYIKEVLGKTLYDKICDDYAFTYDAVGTGSTLSGLYLEMFDDYITPMLIHKSTELYLAIAPYSVTNAGVTKSKTDMLETISLAEKNSMVSISRGIYDMYHQRFVEWLKINSINIPEYPVSLPVSSQYIMVNGWFLKRA